MLLDTYKAQDLIWLTTINAKTKSGQYAFRGDLVVKEGEMNEAAGKRNPPIAMIKEAVLLASEDKLLMVVGNFADVLELPEFIARFTPELADDCKPVFFVDNVKESVIVDVDGRSYTLIPLTSGMIWNELLDLCYLEKSDLKGQSTEDKVVTAYKALKDFKPKFKTVTLEEAIATRTASKREAWGAV
ncbi:MAG: hypothetical protein RI964_2782 [Pseudomonadota bacterium]|jgi:hypothetical protein